MPDQIAPGLVQLGEDFQSHRITGRVIHARSRGLNPHLDVPLISHVEGGLWQGGCMNGVKLPDEFDFVLSLYPWEKYTLGDKTARMEVKMYDSLDQTFETVDDCAKLVNERLDRDQQVLVHCQAGLNRSGLLAARILVMRGRTPAKAIALLREQRSPLVLCNEAFENWLFGLTADQ